MGLGTSEVQRGAVVDLTSSVWDLPGFGCPVHAVLPTALEPSPLSVKLPPLLTPQMQTPSFRIQALFPVLSLWD